MHSVCACRRCNTVLANVETRRWAPSTAKDLLVDLTSQHSRFSLVYSLRVRIFLRLLNTVMIYILFILTVTANGYAVQLVSTHDTMQSCFSQRTQIVHKLGKPYDNNYQALCVTSSKTDAQGL